MTNNISIAFSSSNEYSTHVAVVMASIIKNNKNATFDFYVLNHDIDENQKNIIMQFINNTNNHVYFVKINDEEFLKFPQNISYIKRETYYRYLIAKLLPNVNKILYLDCDVIVNGDISSLWNIVLNDYYCAGVRDLWIESAKHKTKIGLSKNDLYVNAGVLLLNLEKIRNDNMMDKLFENTYKLKNIIKYCDQDIINITFNKKILEIDSKYNFMTTNWEKEDHIRKFCIIRHWNGEIKPWDNKINNYSDFYLYFYYKNFTPFADKIKIFEIYHDESRLYATDVLTPIQTGTKNLSSKLLKDDTGDNIAIKNEHYAELTANYWVWKNYLKAYPDTEYIGFCHYRRFIDFENEATSKKAFCEAIPANEFEKTFSINYSYKKLEAIVKDYDIILPEIYTTDNDVTIYEHYIENHPKEAIDKLIDIVKQKYPDYEEDLNNYLNGNSSYFCLNYVMKKNLFNDFMLWTFDLLTQLDKIMDWDKYVEYMDKKTPAYLMERFFNVWLRHKIRVDNIKVLERKSILLDTNIDVREYKIMPFVKIKHNGTKRILNIAGIKFTVNKIKSNTGDSVLKIGKLKIGSFTDLAKKFQMNYIPKKNIKLVATLLVRDEIDIIEENIKFHLNSGVDFIIATDNGSIDGTRDVLLKYQELGKLKLIDEPEQNYDQVKWVDRMIRIAKKEYNADWIINLDADEFWLSDLGNLKKDLQLLDDYNTVYVPSLFMAPQDIGENKPFYYNTRGKFKALLKVIHKSKGYQKIEMGSHDVKITNKKHTYYNGITLFHYFVRSYEQFEYKVKISGEALLKNKNLKKDEGKQMLYYYNLYQKGKLKDVYRKNFLIQKEDDYIKNSKMLDYYENNSNSLVEKIHKTLEKVENAKDLIV